MHRESLFAAMGAALLALAGCGDEVEQTEESAKVEEANPAAACADDETIRVVGEIVFEGAAEIFPGDASAIESMGEDAKVSLSLIVLDGVDETTKRTDCSARLTIGIPEEIQGRFDDEEELTFDIEYAIQPSADGDGEIVEVSEGYREAATAIATAFLDEGGQLGEVAQKEQPVEEKPAQQTAKTYNPSFSCKGRLSFSEKTVCEDATLSRLDRQMSQAYENALDYVHTPVGQRAIAQRQREWISERDSCGQNQGYECYVDSYNSRISELNEYR